MSDSSENMSDSSENMSDSSEDMSDSSEDSSEEDDSIPQGSKRSADEAMGEGQGSYPEKRIKMEVALKYVHQVQDAVPYDKLFYEFAKIVVDFKRHKIDTAKVIALVSSLFRNYHQLLVDFCTFLPSEYIAEVHRTDQGSRIFYRIVEGVTSDTVTNTPKLTASSSNAQISSEQEQPSDPPETQQITQYMATTDTSLSVAADSGVDATPPLDENIGVVIEDGVVGVEDWSSGISGMGDLFEGVSGEEQDRNEEVSPPSPGLAATLPLSNKFVNVLPILDSSLLDMLYD